MYPKVGSGTWNCLKHDRNIIAIKHLALNREGHLKKAMSIWGRSTSPDQLVITHIKRLIKIISRNKTGQTFIRMLRSQSPYILLNQEAKS